MSRSSLCDEVSLPRFVLNQMGSQRDLDQVKRLKDPFKWLNISTVFTLCYHIHSTQTAWVAMQISQPVLLTL